jgi:ABC-type nitrate/sulfonate/bicarbonate transport system permease component
VKNFSGRGKLISALSVICAIGLWEYFGKEVDPIFASYPSAIVEAFVDLVRNGVLLKAFLQSMKALAAGYCLAAVVGVTLGLILGRYRLAESGLGIYIYGLDSTPLIALIPLFILWLGLGFSVKVLIIFLLAVTPIVMNTWAGVKSVPRTLIELGDAFVASDTAIMRKIILPATLPYIMTGLRLAVGRSIISMVVAEFFTSISGLGGLILKSGESLNTAQMFVPVILLTVLGLCLTNLVSWLEHKVAPWQKETTGARP